MNSHCIYGNDNCKKCHKAKVHLKGWWWKRFFKKYRSIQQVMQTILDKKSPNIQNSFYDLLVDSLKNGSNVSFIQSEEYKISSESSRVK